MTIANPETGFRYWDLETAPLPPVELAGLEPKFTAPSNIKDPVKIAAKIEEKREKWYNDAALSPLTGQILVATVEWDDGVRIYDADEIGETALLIHLSQWFANAGMGANYKPYGFNVFDFDLPWFVRRCLFRGVSLPHGLLSMRGRWPEWAPWLVDLRTFWACGDRRAVGSLDAISKALGMEGKEGSGAEFAGMWRTPGRRAAAVAYVQSEYQAANALISRIHGIAGNAVFGTRGVQFSPPPDQDDDADDDADANDGNAEASDR